MEQIEERLRPAEPLLPETFEALYLAEYRSMVRLAFVMVEGSAEEVVQDAFAKIYERWGSIDRPRAYLRTCVVNGSRDVLRRRRLAVWRRPDPVPEVAELGADHLLDALGALTPRQRAAVVLRYYEDLSERQTADALGCSVSAVKSLVSRGLETLRAEVKGDVR